ncbi:MAG: hypothetical protein AAGL90_07590 [Pseudomonadota bacterium]
MKWLIAASALSLLGGCISSEEFDRERAYSKCESIDVKTSRDRCIADAIRRAELQRDRATDRAAQLEEDAERRALERAKAGIE